MKVVLIGSINSYAGSSHSLVDLASHLAKENYEVIVVFNQADELKSELIDKNIKLLYLPFITAVLDSKFNRSIKWIKILLYSIVNPMLEIYLYIFCKKEKVNLIHINTSSRDFGYYTAKALKVPLVWHLREFLEDDLNYSFINARNSIKKLSKADCLIAVSEAIKEKFQHKLGSRENIVTIYNGIDVSSLLKIEKKYNSEKIRIALIGRITRNKGQLEFIKSLKFLNPDIRQKINLNLYGDLFDKKLEEELIDEIIKLGMKENIHFIGFLGSKEEIYQDTDIVVVPSANEAFGRVTIESLVSGCFVLGADTGGTKELINHIGKGRLYKQGNPMDLADNLEKSIESIDFNNIIEMPVRKDIASSFSKKTNAEEILNVYKRFINS